jgi:hypothetical protein
MNRIDFLKHLGLGGLALGVATTGIRNINADSNNTLNKSDGTIDTPEELRFHILKDGEVFHPIHREYKVNRKGEVSYINNRNKVFKCKLNKHSITGQYGYRLKNTNVQANRFVYEAFTGIKLTQSYLVISKDDNPQNVSIDNLKCVRKKEYTKYKHVNLSKTALRNSKGQTIKWI